ncbi:MAG: hypothetical protein ACTSU2_15930 [Promethearchaeota archaeon]
MDKHDISQISEIMNEIQKIINNNEDRIKKIIIVETTDAMVSIVEDNSNLTNLVFIDANFLFLPVQFKINIYDGIRELLEGDIYFIISEEILKEIIKKQNTVGSPKFKIESNTSIKILINRIKDKRDNFIIFKGERKSYSVAVDDYILIKIGELKQRLKGKGLNRIEVFLATNDKVLKKKARKKEINIIYMREKKKLGIL